MTTFSWTYQQQEAFHECPFLYQFEYRLCQIEYTPVQRGYKIQIHLPNETSIVPTFVSGAACSDIEAYCKALVDAAPRLNTPGKRLIAIFLEKPWLPRWMTECVKPSKSSIDTAVHLLLLASTDRFLCSGVEDGILLENPGLPQYSNLLSFKELNV